jgi:hypothetical protein
MQLLIEHANWELNRADPFALIAADTPTSQMKGPSQVERSFFIDPDTHTNPLRVISLI